MTRLAYHAWTTSDGQMTILNARHIVSVTEGKNGDWVEVKLVTGEILHIKAPMTAFKDWLSTL
ncbi:hypothetical protein EDE08_10695 [Bradyrhizobium sp. R2.2-H]|jgi:desulfoferrodoxin (superoxide reductase-like protein)|uniref:hypothetical protein n=1 Tax=unclassified Bradyrhizobium TaxID=2631580 RepID=UPI0010495926|nr:MULTISPECIES: hypothetical protein [unclassified Bradyrhizobium]TCU71444.1 hypothetical protein EDE10_106311 [Bradyrhizobium sp. Y-H1]TCU73037.1 hypothetical protein EDE08_10695 [Bradyrhizobium sp. R2.2-H]